MEVTVAGGRSLHIWFDVDIRDVLLVFKDTAGNVVPSGIVKIESASFIVGDAPAAKLKLTPDIEDRGFRVKPFRVAGGWQLKGEQNKSVKFRVKLERNGTAYNLTTTVDAVFMSGIPSVISMEGSCFEKVLSREQFITCKLKLIDEWGNLFRGLDNVVNAEVAVSEQSFLRGNSTDGPLVPLTNVKEGIVSVDQKNLSVYLTGRYGMKESITFSCTVIDHRVNPAFKLKTIDISQAFEVEDLELQYCIPPLISNKFRTRMADGCFVIEVDHGVVDVQRKSLFGIFLQLVKKGSSKLFTSHRRDKRIVFERFKISDDDGSPTDENDESQIGNDAFSLDLIDGKSAALDKYLRTDASFCYQAKYDEIEAQMKILVIAGKPTKINFEPVDTLEVGHSAMIRFVVMDEKDLPVKDLSRYNFVIQPDEERENLSVKISEPVHKHGAVHGFECTVEGTLPEDLSGPYLLRVILKMIEKSPAILTSMSEDMTDSDSESPLHIASERVEITVLPGSAKALRLVSRNGSHCDALGEHLEIVTGTKFEYIVQAVDKYGNVDSACRRRVRLVATSESADDKTCSGTGVLAQGEAVLLLGPWFARGARGTLTLDVNDKSGPRLETKQYELQIRAGTWPAELRILSPVEAAAGGVVELDDTVELLGEVEAEVRAADGSAYTYSRLEVLLKQANGPTVVPEFLEGRYRLADIPIPREPGDYVMELAVSNPGGASISIPPKALKMRRTLGRERAQAPNCIV